MRTKYLSLGILHKQLDLFINPVVRKKALHCKQGYIELFMIVNICHKMQEKADEKTKAKDRQIEKTKTKTTSSLSSC